MSQQDDIKAFNQYCSEVMGYEKTTETVIAGHWHIYVLNGIKVCRVGEYDPYSNLNQLAEVFDKLWANRQSFLVLDVSSKGIATAMREFIESTHD